VARPFTHSISVTDASARTSPDVVHAAFDHAHAHVLHRGREQPRERAAERIVWGEAGMERAAGEEVPDLGVLEILLGPGAGALELDAIIVDRRRAREFLQGMAGPNSWRQ
jgi:hypothetical protein